MKKLSYIIASAILALTATSCSDFLDAENKSAGGDQMNSETYFSTPEGLSAFRGYAFLSLQKLAESLDINDDGTDLYAPSRGQSPSAFQEYSITPDQDAVKNYYVACTGLINNANGLIQFSGEDNKLYRAEGLFLRAYGYYLMTQHFGAVPYSAEYIQSANRTYPKETLEAIYTNCENDLLEVIETAEIPTLSHDGSVNKKAAQALLAKIYLAHGWDCNTTLTDEAKGTYTVNSTENFSNAAKYAEAAIADVPLTQSFEAKWLPSNEATNPETFFAVQYEKAGYPGEVADAAHSVSTYYSHYHGASTDGQKASRSNKSMNTRSLTIWEKGDTRWEGTFMTTYYQYDKSVGDWTKNGYFAYYSSADKNTLPIAYYYAPSYVTKEEFEAYLKAHKSQFAVKADYAAQKPHANLLHENQILVYNFNADGSFKSPTTVNATLTDDNKGTSLERTPCVKKYDDPTAAMGGYTNSWRDLVVLHASETYLTAAEAYAMAGDNTQALAKINAVRDRAGAPHLNSLSDYQIDVMLSNFSMIDLVLDERARECYAEQTRWMDLRRTKQLVRYNVAYNPYVESVADMQNVKGETKWYRPIPAAEIAGNEGMTDADQNPGY